MRIHEAAASRDIPLGNALRRVPSRPLCAGARGDVAALANFVGTNDVVREKLLQRRAHVVSHSWVFHQEFGDLARRLLEKWTLPTIPTPALRAAEREQNVDV